MALEAADEAKIKEMIQSGIKAGLEAGARDLVSAVSAQVGQGLEQRLAAFKGELKPEGKGDPKPDGKGAEGKGELARDPETEKKLAAMERELRAAAVAKHAPKTLNPDRLGVAVQLLESQGRLLTRNGEHILRLERNGALVDVPLAQGLSEWAGTKEADIFSLPPASGAGSVGGQAAAGAAQSKVPLSQVLGLALGQAR